MFKLIKLNLFLLGICLSLSSYAKSLGDLCAEVREQVQQGDLVFVEIDNKLFENVAKTQGHWSSHIGIAMKHEGEWVVAESTIPVSKMTPFCKYIEKGHGTRVALKRYYRPLSDSEVEKLHASAEKRMGVLYHTGFKLHSKRQFCSKFVDQVYTEAIGQKVGYIQNFRQLLDSTEYPEVEKFWRWWFFGNIPWQRETLTPASQFHDPNFDEVYYYSARD